MPATVTSRASSGFTAIALSYQPWHAEPEP